MKNVVQKISSNKRILLFFALVIVLVFSFYGRVSSSESAIVRKENIREFLFVPGKVVSEKDVNLSFKVTGKIEELPVKEGDLVQSGDIVARLDTGELYLALGRARDDLREKEATLAKTYDEVKDNDIDESYSQRKSRTISEVARDKAVKSVVSAQKSLSDFSLTAPFDSTVIDVGVELGEWVSALSLDEYHVKLADLSNTYFEVEVDQESIVKIQSGQEVVIRLDAYEDEQFIGKVFLISKIVKKTSEGDSVVNVKISFSNLPENMILGLEGDAEIILLNKENVLTIPKNAPIKEGSGRYVKVSGQKREVDLGIFDGAKWEVLSGLSEGEKVSW